MAISGLSVTAFIQAVATDRQKRATEKNTNNKLKLRTFDFGGLPPRNCGKFTIAGKYVCRKWGYLWLSKSPIIATMHCHCCMVTAPIGHFDSHNKWFIQPQHAESLEGHPLSRRIYLPEVRLFMAFKKPNYCRDASPLLHRHGTNQTLWKPQRVIYSAPACRITRGASPEQANIFAGSEVIYGFQNAQLLPRCIAIAASSWHQSDTLKATTSDLSSAATPNH